MPGLYGLRYGEPVDGSPSPANNVNREKIVVVGLGMVAISFMYELSPR
jgi:nitrite reductase (NAD(P)H)